MCGIAGLVIKDGCSYDYLKEYSDRFKKELKHRGPDADGDFIDEKKGVLLSHTRLSIIDISEASNQPFIRDDIVLIYNGEIYNFRELRDELISKGYRFDTQGDTEVLLRAYQEYGEDAFEKFIGMFSIGIFDNRKNLLYLVRDRYGIKPLYYYLDSKKLIFSSEMRIFADFETDEDFKIYFLLFGYLPNLLTTKKRVRTIEKGTIFRLDLTNFSTKIKDFKKTNLDYKKDLDERSIIKQTRELFEQAVRRHLISDAPLGVFLSGGIDSSLISIVASRNLNIPIKTLAVQFNEASFSEERYQNLVADIIGSDHWAHTITYSDFEKSFDDIISAIDQPSIDGVNTYFVSKMAREAGVKTVLSGLGGDELFMGYGYFGKIDNIIRFKKSNILPDSVVRQIGWWTGNERFRKVALLGNKSDLFIYLTMRCMFIPLDISRLTGVNREKIIKMIEELSSGVDFIYSKDYKNTLSRLEMDFYMLGQLLKDADYMSMWHSIETRVPFLDNELAEFVLSIPSRYKYRKAQQKYLLTEAFRDLLPNEIIFRRKMGFTFPFDIWLRERLDFYKEIVRGSRIFDNDFIDKIFERFRMGKTNFSRVWALVVLSAKKW